MRPLPAGRWACQTELWPWCCSCCTPRRGTQRRCGRLVAVLDAAQNVVGCLIVVQGAGQDTALSRGARQTPLPIPIVCPSTHSPSLVTPTPYPQQAGDCVGS